MKKPFVIQIVLVISLGIGLVACSTAVKQIGKVNMISNRNVDPNLKYQLISSYSGGSNNELKRAKATTIEDAIDKTVKKVPGGEFIMNGKIFLVNNIYFAVEGDVWGPSGTISYRGFKTGDKVTWKSKGVFYTGTITALKDDKTCYVKVDNGDKTTELTYDEVTKVDATLINSNTGQSGITNNAPVETTFKVGDKVRFQLPLGDKIDGKIIETYPDAAIIEYYRPNGKVAKIKRKYSEISK